MTEDLKRPSRSPASTLADELEALNAGATPGRWMIYDSNSWRRIGLDGGYKEIIWPTKHQHDGCPDLTGKNLRGDLNLLLWLRNHVPEIINALRSPTPSETAKQISVASEVADERQRQKDKEGWTEAHDDGHTAGCMAVAGACYALLAAAQCNGENEYWRDRYLKEATELWPWDREWWKPKNIRRDLIRAAALIVAEIERLDRTGGERNSEGKS